MSTPMRISMQVVSSCLCTILICTKGDRTGARTRCAGGDLAGAQATRIPSWAVQHLVHFCEDGDSRFVSIGKQRLADGPEEVEKHSLEKAYLAFILMRRRAEAARERKDNEMDMPFARSAA